MKPKIWPVMFCRCCHLNFGTISQIVVVYFSIEKFTVNWKLSIHWNMFEKSKEKLQRYSRRHNKNYAHASTSAKRRSSAVRTYLNVRGKGCAAHGTGRRSEASESPSPLLNCLLHLYVIVADQNKPLSSNITKCLLPILFTFGGGNCCWYCFYSWFWFFCLLLKWF